MDMMPETSLFCGDIAVREGTRPFFWEKDS
jgi:hypothetical protein